jgi:hypothetical protein
MYDPNVMVPSIINGMLSGVNLVVSNIPWWVWLMIIVSAVLKVEPKKKSRKRRWGY